MLKPKIVGGLVLSLGLAFIARSALARFDLAFDNDISNGTAYEWYMPTVKLSYDSASRDGTMSGVPYVLFQGNDASPNGHCLELSLSPGATPPPYVQVKVNDHGTYKVVTNASLDSASYSTVRLWVNRNTGTSSLNWSLYVVANDGNTTFSGDVNLAIRRLEVSKAGCTTAQTGGSHSSTSGEFPWVSFEGQTSNYKITKGNF